MQLTQNDLERAFNSSRLPLLGYTFDVAINTHALAICLKHLAQRKTPQTPEPEKSRKNPAKEYWFNNI